MKRYIQKLQKPKALRKGSRHSGIGIETGPDHRLRAFGSIGPILMIGR